MSEEKKMTDEEIVKALENCANDEMCRECPYFINGIDCGNQRSENDYLDLIHRLQSENVKQKAEIERLALAVEGLKGENKVIHKENDELLGKIERLTKENSNVISMNDALYREKAELQKQVDELKEERYYTEQDTAKEILQQMYDETEPCTKSHEWVRKRIKEIAKSKGVEVK